MEAPQHSTPFLVALWKETDGQDMVEYALLLAFLAIAAVSFLTGIKSSMTSIWTKASSTLSSAATSAS